MDTRQLGLLIVGLGLAVAVVGGILYFGGLSWFGRLPGDFRAERGQFKIFFPLASMLVLSLLLTLLLNLFRRWF